MKGKKMLVSVPSSHIVSQVFETHHINDNSSDESKTWESDFTTECRTEIQNTSASAFEIISELSFY